MPELLGILGSVTPPGRMLKAVNSMLETARREHPGLEAASLNLADYRISFADGRAPDQYGDDTPSVVEMVMGARALVIASPVYRASFTGALKNLLDQLPVEALMGKPCGIVAMGATSHHFLGVDWHLRDVLTWFGALVAPTSVYLSSADFADGEPTEEVRRQLGELARTVLRLRAVAAAGGEPLGPAPLAARRH